MKRKVKDILLQILTSIFSGFGILTLIALSVFVFAKGGSILSWKMLSSDYYSEVYNLKYEENNTNEFTDKEIQDSFYSIKWGVALKDTYDVLGEPVVVVSYVDEYSPLRGCKDQTNGSDVAIQENQILNKVVLLDETGNYYSAFARNKAQKIAETMDKGSKITDLQLQTQGGGIRGSLLSTLALIGLTLVISIPIGISAAIYFSEYAKNNWLTKTMRTLIDMTSGVPSIVFGLVGATVFIPFVNKTFGSSGQSIIAGALTLSIMLLPIIIRTTEESLITIPQNYRSASLALGASKAQTIFKVVLPNAMSGILTAILLSIGRIIGESAALIFTMGTAIKDMVRLNANSTSLAVHIWSIMAGDKPNYDGACAISIVILIVVLVLNVLVKLISKRMKKYEVQK